MPNIKLWLIIILTMDSKQNEDRQDTRAAQLIKLREEKRESISYQAWNCDISVHFLKAEILFSLYVYTVPTAIRSKSMIGACRYIQYKYKINNVKDQGRGNTILNNDIPGDYRICILKHMKVITQGLDFCAARKGLKSPPETFFINSGGSSQKNQFKKLEIIKRMWTRMMKLILASVIYNLTGTAEEFKETGSFLSCS